jgi:uncharacterized protein YjlB
VVDDGVFAVRTYLLKEAGNIPNNDTLPLLVYAGAIQLPDKDPASTCEAVFGGNGWGGMWRNGIFGFHHYHSTAHEVLGVYRGTARVQFGGENGVLVTVGAGDVIIIPAGVAHKNTGSSHDFGVVGAYPAGQNWDMNYGKANERPQADRNISQAPLPQKDPVFGADGPLKQYWS